MAIGIRLIALVGTCTPTWLNSGCERGRVWKPPPEERSGSKRIGESSDVFGEETTSEQWHSEVQNHPTIENGDSRRQVMDPGGEITGVNYRAPVSVYCGPDPGFKPVHSKSVDSNLHLQANGWASRDKAFLHSSVNPPLKKTCFVRSGEGTGGWVLERSDLYRLLDGDGPKSPSHTRGYSLSLDWSQGEVKEPFLETLQLKNKLKRQMSENLPRRGETVVPLKPALARSTTQRLLNAPRPVPPIERSASPQGNRGVSSEEQSSESKNDGAPEGPGLWLPGEGAEAKPIGTATIPEEVRNSLLHLRSSAERKRKLLGASLSQSTSKSPNSALDSIHSVPAREQQTVTQMLQLVRASRETGGNPRAAHKHTEEREARVTGGCVLEAAELPVERVEEQNSPGASTLVPSRFSAVLTRGANGRRSVEDDETQNEKRQLCHVTISKSAQDKMHQKRREEMEQRRLQMETRNELTQPPRERMQNTVSLPDEELLSTQETRSPNLGRISNDTSLRQRINRTSLPNIPNISQMYHESRHFSAHSLPGFPLNSNGRDRDSDEEESLEMKPFSRQEQGLTEALKLLANSDWEMKQKGLRSVRRLARFHSETLQARLHDVCLAVTKEVSNLRSKVARSAILSLSGLFSHLRRNLDQEVDEVTRILLHKTGDSNEFIREEAGKALAVMAESVSPWRALAALVAGGVNHRNSIVRKCAAENLLRVVQHLGPERVLSGPKESTEQIVRAVGKFSQDGNSETRFYGRKMLNVLMSHPEFDQCLGRLLLSHDLQHVITAAKQRSLGDASSDLVLSRDWRSRANSSSNSQENICTVVSGESDTMAQKQPMIRRPTVRIMESVEQVKELSKLLCAKDFQERMRGINLLLQHCEANPGFVTANLVNIFDAFTPRLQDSNKKVNQLALRSMATMVMVLKDNLHRVLHSTVTIVADNLNSKNAAIYSAAVQVLDGLISNVDNLLLLQPFASRVQFVSGQALQDVTERLAGLVPAVYQRKPQAVERHVLPALWYLLSNMMGSGVIRGGGGNVRAVTGKLASNLHQQMGGSLLEYAASQPAHVTKTLLDLLAKEL
ncbi:TOG array regulator of axonemal microtubules protein 2 [Callorhinchus milii]|uniref:TOG array regulator of axonemal microtubules protein 2 n=1 Tax=Callorhinchus milii TaxID=7868 RepID=UPI000457303B|nr:TOG array regulator of axonemal microtubules protein 2 [Callorhinchus milii]|eukprot:gi/632958538/ref/XP_007895093.1/ PREDICTED: protein FAM179A [Callorhinchus milii]